MSTNLRVRLRHFSYPTVALPDADGIPRTWAASPLWPRPLIWTDPRAAYSDASTIIDTNLGVMAQVRVLSPETAGPDGQPWTRAQYGLSVGRRPVQMGGR